MKKMIISAFYLIVSTASYSQSMINCKSGQVINITTEGVFVSSNLKELANAESKKPEIIDLMNYILLQEQNNRINAYVLNRKISLIEIDSKLDKSTAKKTELKTKKARLSELEKEYKNINNSINSIRKRDKVVVGDLTREMIASKDVVADLDLTPTQNEAVESTVQTLMPKEETAQPTISEDKQAESESELIKASDDARKNSKDNKNKKESAKPKQPSNKDIKNRDSKDKPQNKINLAKVVECNQFEIISKDNYSSKYATLTEYTPAKLENYFKQESFLTFSAGVDIKEDIQKLKVKCDFVPRDISKSYGAVAMSDFLRIQFINGKNIFLKAVSVKGPIVEQYSGHSIFELEYRFESKDDLEKLKESLVDSIGIMWSTGFEDYQIYNIDFFQTLFKDLDICKKSKLH